MALPQFGTLWVDDLPLAEGENDVALTVINSAGLSSETDFSVVKSDMTLTLDYIDGDLWGPTVNLRGSIDPGYTVTINGAQGTNDGMGHWSASQVPVSGNGVANFDLTASPAMMMSAGRMAGMAATANTTSGNPVNANKSVDKPDELKLDSGNWRSEIGDNSDADMGGAMEYYNDTWNWSRSGGGTETIIWDAYSPGGSEDYKVTRMFQLALNRTVPQEVVDIAFSLFPEYNTNYTTTDVDALDSDWQHEVPQEQGAMSYRSPTDPNNWWKEAGKAILIYLSGGRIANGDQSLYVATASVTEKMMVNGGVVFTNVPPERVTVAGLGQHLDTNGTVMKVMPTQQTLSYDLQAGVPRSTDNIPLTSRYRPRIHLTGGADVTDKTRSAVVGQKISLTCELDDLNGNRVASPCLTNFAWTVPGNTFSDYVATASSAVLYKDFSLADDHVGFYWIDQGIKQVVCTAQVMGETGSRPPVHTTFAVVRPDVTWTLTPKDSVAVDTNYVELVPNISVTMLSGLEKATEQMIVECYTHFK